MQFHHDDENVSGGLVRSSSQADAVTRIVRRDASVETLRGLACLLLVAYHVRGGDPGSGLRLTDDNPWSYAVDSLVYLRMPLFSFLSGVVYALRPARSAYPGFVRGKARRLLVPLLVIGTAFAVVQTVTPDTNAGEQASPWYLWHVVPVGHFWFLESIFWVFMVIAALDRFRLLESRLVVAAVIGVAVLLGPVVGVPHNVLGLETALYLLPFFLSGVAGQRFSWRRASPSWLRAAIAVVAICLTIYSQLGLLGLVHRLPAHGSALASTLGVALCLTLLLPTWHVRPLVVIGGFSFTIYTCHVFATSAIRMVLTRLGIDSVSLNMVVGIAVGVAFGIAVEVLARRNGWSAALILGRRWPGTSTELGRRAERRRWRSG